MELRSGLEVGQFQKNVIVYLLVSLRLSFLSATQVSNFA